MNGTTPVQTGSVASLWRYPVKSMLGEVLNLAEITNTGLFGDRAYALIDDSDGKIATAKNPRKWPQLFQLQAAVAGTVQSGATAPQVRITLPDGSVLDSGQTGVHGVLSNVLGRAVTLTQVGARPPGAAATAEEYRLGAEGSGGENPVSEFDLLQGTFFDSAFVHVVTTATLNRLHALYPQGRFDIRRFRPNIVVETSNAEEGFVENAWIGSTLAIGESVRLMIKKLCIRCVMTTLPQGNLPNDPGILRTAAKHNGAQVGLYASVLQCGQIRCGDPVRVE